MRLLSSLLLVVLTGCATAPLPEKVLPPAELLQDCPEPAVNASTNGALARTIQELRASLQGCNRDKATLRSWAEEGTK